MVQKNDKVSIFIIDWSIASILIICIFIYIYKPHKKKHQKTDNYLYTHFKFLPNIILKFCCELSCEIELFCQSNWIKITLIFIKNISIISLITVLKVRIMGLIIFSSFNCYKNTCRHSCCLKTQTHTNVNWNSIETFICEIKLFCRDSKSINTLLWDWIIQNILRPNNIVFIVTSSLMDHVTSITSAFVYNHYFLSSPNDLLTLMLSKGISLNESK